MPDELVLMDAYSQIFRCFFAVKALSNDRGEPVNALLPFGRILLHLEKQYPGCAGAVVFDCGKVQFRLRLCPEYKANRPPAPEALKRQVPFIRELCGLFGWTLLEEPEYEADDLIAALACDYAGKVHIISSDKDLAQLVTGRISMQIPARKGGWETRDEAKVRDRFGVHPGQMVDYLALLGDAADNIPGVPGIGPKGASQILEQCGSLENFFSSENPPVSPRIAGILRENREQLAANRKLITLRTDLPPRLVSAAQSCCKKAPDWAGIRAFCQERGLYSLLKELPDDGETSLFDELPETFACKREKNMKPEQKYEQGDLFAGLEE